MIAPLRLAAVTAAAVTALGCLAAASHDLTPANDAAPQETASVAELPGSPAPAWQPDSDDDYPCPFVAGPDYLQGGGDNSQVIQDNGHAYMGCGDGPTISLDGVDGDTATFSLHGDRVRIREGASDHLGPYWVHVIDVQGRRVRLELSDPH